MNRRNDYRKFLKDEREKVPKSTRRRMNKAERQISDSIEACKRQKNTTEGETSVADVGTTDNQDLAMVEARYSGEVDCPGEDSINNEMAEGSSCYEGAPESIPESEQRSGMDNSSDNDSEDGLSGTDSDEEINIEKPDGSSESKFFETSSTGFCIFEILLMVLSFGMKYSLSYEAIQDLLNLISILLNMPSLPTSKYFIKKIFQARNGLVYHFVCSLCGAEVHCCPENPHFGKKESVVCGACKSDCDLKSSNYFVTLSIADQLKNLFKNSELALYLLKRPNNFDKNSKSDISDGNLYRLLKEEVNLKSSDVTITFNTDGMQKFKSNFGSIWAILAYINELPAKVRFSEMLCCGLWFGKGEPCMSTFFKTFVSELSSLRNGFEWQYKNSRIITRVFAICCCVDSKARSPLLNMIQFNGYYGCPWCYHRGELVKSATNSNGTVKYVMSSGLYEERTDREMRDDMANACVKGHNVCGMKGMCPLYAIPKFNLSLGMVVDYMHCVMLGVVRQLFMLWLESVPSKAYYIGNPNTLAVIDSKIVSIKVNRTFQRIPRRMSDFHHWKAQEFKNFLLFYSLPVLVNILPIPYYTHLKYLVSSMFMLLKQHISENELSKCESDLKNFVLEYEKLYEKDSMTFNVHQLLHLSKSVRDLGPLWAHSCFPFESFNRILLNQVNSPKGVVTQIINKFRIRDSLNRLFLKEKERIHTETVSFLSRMADFNYRRDMQFTSGDKKCHMMCSLSDKSKIQLYRSKIQCAGTLYTKCILFDILIVSTENPSKAARVDSFIQYDGKVYEVSCISECKDTCNGLIIGWEWEVQPFEGIPHIVILRKRKEFFTSIHVTLQPEKLLIVDCGELEYACCIPNRVDPEW